MINFKNNKILNWIMDNHGEIMVVGAIILIILTGIGVLIVYNSSNSLYIGDTESNEYLDYFKCEELANQIPEENLIIFKSEKEAISGGYNATEGCT